MNLADIRPGQTLWTWDIASYMPSAGCVLWVDRHNVALGTDGPPLTVPVGDGLLFADEASAAKSAEKFARHMHAHYQRLADIALAAIPSLAAKHSNDDAVDYGTIPEPVPDGLEPETDDLYVDVGDPVGKV